LKEARPASDHFLPTHELGHLVLHQDGKMTGRKVEEEANQFASEFLMPKSDIKAHIRDVYVLDQLLKLKKRWKVFVSAPAYRLHKLEYLSDWKYRDFCIQISSRFRQTEPEGIGREKTEHVA
jgi:Zn-dependent peptidase ImmA (M78 family)